MRLPLRSELNVVVKFGKFLHLSYCIFKCSIVCFCVAYFVVTFVSCMCVFSDNDIVLFHFQLSVVKYGICEAYVCIYVRVCICLYV